MNKHMTFCVFLSLVIAFGLRAQDFQLYSCATNPPDFSKLSYHEAEEAGFSEADQIAIGAKKICPEYITNLVNELQNGRLDDNRKALAIHLMGSLCPTDTNSIEVLIKYIDLKDTNLVSKTRTALWGAYPAEEALVCIGKPSVNPILQHLPNETYELRRHLMCEALVLIEGKNDAMFNESDGKAKVHGQITNLLAAESDSSKKANLELALKGVETLTTKSGW